MKKNKTWAYGITFTLIGFAGLMTGFAIIASHHTENLVVKDYYKEEIAFQKQIEKIHNTAALPEEPVIEWDSLKNNLQIHIPTTASGFITFYRPNDDSKDFKVPISLSSDGRQIIPVSEIEKGLWKIQLDWTSDGKDYYFEKRLNLHS